MARKPTGKPRGRPTGQTKWDYDFSQLLLWLFQREMDRGSTYDEAAAIVAKHPDLIELINKPHAGVALRTPNALKKRYQRALEEQAARVRAGLHMPGMRPPVYADWENEPIRDANPVDPEAYAARPRVTINRRRD